MLGLAILVIVCLSLLVVRAIREYNERPENFPPGPPRLPIWGSYWFLLKENFNMLHFSLETLGKKHKTDILGFYLGGLPAVVTLSHELSKEVLSRDEFIGRFETIVTQTRSHGATKGIFFTEGPLWKTHRRFSLRHMRDYGFGRRSETLENFFADEVKYLVNFLDNEPKPEDMDICKAKGHVKVPDFLYGTLINTIMQVLTSTQYDPIQMRKYARTALHFTRSGDSTGNALNMTPWVRYIAPAYFGYTSAVEDSELLFNFMKIQIDEHIRTFSDDHHRDFIDTYISENIKQGTELDYDQLVLVAIDYMFPSPVTLGSTLSFLFAFMVNYPEVQKKIQEEIDRVVGRDRYPRLDDRKNMPYLEASIREVLRILPTVPLGITRKCIQDTYLGGYFIPKNSAVMPNLWTAHRDERVFANPEKFMPERFLEEDGSLMKKDLTLPFGAGKRLCVGETFSRQAIFLILSGLLQNFTFTSPNGQPFDLYDLVPGLAVSYRDIWVLAVPR